MAGQPTGGGSERRTAPIELFWDLVFAFAVTRVTALLVADLSWPGLGRAILALALVWWAWSAFAWVTNAQDPDTPSFRAALLLAAALIFIAGLAVPQAYGAEGTLFAATYTGVRMLHLGLYVEASRRGQASLSAIAGFAVTVSIGMALLLAGSFASEGVRIPLWVAAAAIDYAGPAWLTRDRLRQLQQVAVAHFAERYSLFVIICLGESIVAIGIGASVQSLSAASVTAVTFALLITVGMWWTYFDRFAAVAEERLRGHADPVIAAADAYSYLHLVVVAGIIIFAVGARAATAHATQHLAAAERLAMCGGVAVYMLGHAAFLLRMVGRIHVPELVAAALAMVVFAVCGGLPGWATAGVLTIDLALLVGYEMIGEHSPPGIDAKPGTDARTPAMTPDFQDFDDAPLRGTVYTVGHSTRPLQELLDVLDAEAVATLVDVRTLPRSRRNPQFDGGALANALSPHGIAYWHERALGGFRQPRPGTPNYGWQQPGFRGYADHMTSREFAEALERLEVMAADQPTCIMCAEADALSCHRRLIADALVVNGWLVLHLGKGDPREHEVTPIAVVGQDGSLTYPPLQGELVL